MCTRKCPRTCHYLMIVRKYQAEWWKMLLQSSAGLTNIFRPLFWQKNVGKRGIFSKKLVTAKKIFLQCRMQISTETTKEIHKLRRAGLKYREITKKQFMPKYFPNDLKHNRIAWYQLWYQTENYCNSRNFCYLDFWEIPKHAEHILTIACKFLAP